MLDMSLARSSWSVSEWMDHKTELTTMVTMCGMLAFLFNSAKFVGLAVPLVKDKPAICDILNAVLSMTPGSAVCFHSLDVVGRK